MHNIPNWVLLTNTPTFMLALLVPFVLNWKPSPLAFLLMVILNVPTLIFLGIVLPANESAVERRWLHLS